MMHQGHFGILSKDDDDVQLSWRMDWLTNSISPLSIKLNDPENIKFFNMDQTRAAIALNNTGVSLLNRRCYVQAMDTLRDALYLLKIGLDTGERSDTTKPTNHNQNINQKLHKSTRCLLHPEPQQGSIRLEIVSSENLSDQASSAITRGPSSREAVAIRIDTCDQGILADNATVETTIILHNFAVSHLCLASAPTLARPCHLNGAMTLFAASYNVVQMYNETRTNEDLPAYNLLSLEALILSNLVAVLVDVKEAERAKSMYVQFVYLRDAMRQLESLEVCFYHGQHGAAAA